MKAGTKSGMGTWDLGCEDSGTRDLGMPGHGTWGLGTRDLKALGRRDSRT